MQYFYVYTTSTGTSLFIIQWYVNVFVCHRLATKAFVGKLLAMGWVWVITR